MRLATVFSAIGLLNPTVQAQVGFQWEPRAAFPGGGRWSAMTFAIDGMGYVVGGYDGTNTRSDLWMYDPSLDQWFQRADMPSPRRTAGSFAIGGKGYVVCGLTGTSTMHATLFEYDPVADTWSQKASFPGSARYGVFSFAIGANGFVGSGNIGSGDGPFVSDAFAYNSNSNTWSPIAPLPGMARYGTSSFTTGGMGYVHGGRVSSLDFTNDLWVYDATVNTWAAKPAMTGPGRSWAMSMPFENDAVVACGKDVFDVNLYDAYRYVPWMDLWQPIPDFPGNSGWGGASCALGLRVFGGLGRRILAPNEGYFSDWWELVKVHMAGISEPRNRMFVRVVPNPVVGSAQMLRVEGGNVAVGQHFEIVDARGSTSAKGRVAANALIEMDELEPGSYSIIIRRIDGIMTGRFVILR